MINLTCAIKIEAERVIKEFDRNVCSSKNLEGYTGIVVYGGIDYQREQLREAILSNLPYEDDRPFVLTEIRRGDEKVLYVDAGEVFKRVDSFHQAA